MEVVCLLVLDRAALYNPGCPAIHHYVAQSGLQLEVISLS